MLKFFLLLFSSILYLIDIKNYQLQIQFRMRKSIKIIGRNFLTKSSIYQFHKMYDYKFLQCLSKNSLSNRTITSLHWNMIYGFGNQCKNNIGKQCHNPQNSQKCSQDKKCSHQSPNQIKLDIPPQNLQIRHQQQKLGDDTMDCYKTQGAISIISHQLISEIKGTKLTQSGQLYALKFRCGQCNTQGIKSFTKNAYHHGVVLVRCQGCEAVHLVADNLGWFEDNATNLDNYADSPQGVKKVYDPVAVVKFLRTALGKQDTKQTPLEKQKQDK